MIYRNDEIAFTHEREVIQFEEFLGNVAGMYDLLMFFVVCLLGGYIDFVARVKWIKKLYRFTDVNAGPKKEEGEVVAEGQAAPQKNMAAEDGRLDLANMNLAWHYIKCESWASCLIQLFWKESEAEKNQNLIIDKGSECLDEDFNFMNYMERLRKSNFETDQWGQKEKLNYNEYPEDNKVLVCTQGEDEFLKQQEESKKQIQLLIGERLG